MNRGHGTPYYKAPEVWNETYDIRCDLWSVGVTTYYLLSKLMPFNVMPE